MGFTQGLLSLIIIIGGIYLGGWLGFIVAVIICLVMENLEHKEKEDRHKEELKELKAIRAQLKKSVVKR